MSITLEERNQILSEIENSKTLLIKQEIRKIPSNYAELQHAAVMKELHAETEKLSALFSDKNVSTLKALQAAFQELCRNREQDNQDTCLSFTAIPESVCNRLYFNIAMILFKPTSIDQIIPILMPSIKNRLAVEFSDLLSTNEADLPRTQTEKVQMSLQNQPLNTLVAYPAELAQLTKIIVGNDVVFTLEDIERYPLLIHYKLYKQLETHPIVKEKLYTHNDDFKQLSFDISLLEKSSRTPNEMLIKFTHELTRGGSRYTGSEYAAPSVTQACQQFQFYLDQFPKELKKELLALQPVSGNDSLKKILNEHLAKGRCVEEAAARIKLIQQNQRNTEILKKRPHVSEEQFKKMKEKYHQPMKVVGYETSKAIPTSLKVPLLKNINITSTSDYIDLFINLPASEYGLLLTYANITCNPALPDNLTQALEMLNEEQKTAFMTVLVTQRKKFGGIHEVLKFAVNSKMLAVCEEALKVVPDSKLAKIVRKKDAQGGTLLNSIILSKNPELFLLFWQRLSKQDRLTALNDKNNQLATLLHVAARDAGPDVFHALWTESQLSLPLASQAKNSNGNTLLHCAAVNSHAKVFDIIWNNLSAEDQLIQSKLKDHTNKSPLYCAATNSNPIAFKTMWNNLSKKDQVLELQVKDRDGSALLHSAAQNSNPDIFLTIWNSLSEPEQLIALRLKDGYGNTFMHAAMHGNTNPETCKIIFNSLSKPFQSIAIQEGNCINETPLHDAIKTKPENFAGIWESLSEPDPLMVIEKRCLR